MGRQKATGEYLNHRWGISQPKFDTMLNVCNNIRRIREFKNLTQEAVAESIGLSVTAYGNIERGETDINFKRLADIAKALDVKEEDIVTFGYQIYNNTVTNNENGSGHVVVFTNNVNNTVEKDLLERIIKDKDEEIAFLREQLKKG
jgi:transcriptional regulator with XRE-family HTH domain